MIKYFILLLLSPMSIFSQVSGNVEFERSKSDYNYEASSGASSYEKVYLSDTTVLIASSVLMNVKADEFVAVWAIKEESKTIIKSGNRYLPDQSKTARLNILTKKPIIPDENEIKVNSRARSAKLRVAERM